MKSNIGIPGGGGGKIGPGDVQWMTAASGVMHEELHSKAFTKTGGIFEMIQLWINLPAKNKMSRPGYQTLLKDQIPTVALDDGAGQVRVIAGEYRGVRGPARTFTPINLWELNLKSGARVTLDLPEDFTTAIYTRKGRVDYGGNAAEAGETALGLFSRVGQRVSLVAKENSSLLVLNGQAIAEPVVGHGPFVMNSRKEIERAIADVQAGRFGELAPTS